MAADAHAAPLNLGGSRREELPSGGWEQAIVWAFADAGQRATPDTAYAFDISVAAAVQGRGLAQLMLEALRSAVLSVGVRTLLAPVRPIWKEYEPATSISEYVGRVGENGLPIDPWPRTHVRAGGRIAGVATSSWVVTGSLAEWRTWTELPFDRDGDVDVPGALTPVRCDLGAGHAAYVEPNVWVRHELEVESSQE